MYLQTLPTRTERVTTWGDDSELIYVPMSMWGPAIGLDAVMAAIIVSAMAATGGNLVKVQRALQTAEVRVDLPDAWAVVNGGLTVVRENRGPSAELDVSALTAGKAWVRWGVAVFMDTGDTGPASADVTLSMATVSMGKMIGTWKGRLTATSGSDVFVAVTGFVPALWAQTVMAAMTVASASSSFRYRLVYRVAATMTRRSLRPRSPAWRSTHTRTTSPRSTTRSRRRGSSA